MVVALGRFAAPAAAQLTPGPVVRLEGGMLNPGALLPVTFAYGGGVGWEFGGSNAVLLRYIRQRDDRNSERDIGAHTAAFLTANWEHAFGASGPYRRQARLRAGAGALFRYLLPTVPVVATSLELRYPVRPRLAFVGSLEDNVAKLPRQDFQACTLDAFGRVTCSTYTGGGRLLHNFGFLIAAEWGP